MEHTNQQEGEEATSQELQVLKGGPTKLSFERRSCQRPGKGGALGGVGGGPVHVAATWRQLCSSLLTGAPPPHFSLQSKAEPEMFFPKSPIVLAQHSLNARLEALVANLLTR